MDNTIPVFMPRFRSGTCRENLGRYKHAEIVGEYIQLQEATKTIVVWE